MIPQLCRLVWNIFADGFSAYSWKNLWCYLWKGYTVADYTELDVYLTDQISRMVPDLLKYKLDVAELTDDDLQQLRLSILAQMLTLDYKNSSIPHEKMEQIRDEFIDLLHKQFYNLWV